MFRLTARFLRGSYATLTLTIAALALGVALVCAVDLVNRAVLRAFTEVIDTMSGRAALQIRAGQSGVFSEEIAARVARIAGVQLAVPIVSAPAFSADDTGELLTVHGVDVGNEAAVRTYEARDAAGLEIDDPLVFLNQPDSIVVTKAFADRRGLRTGSNIMLDTPVGRRRFTVRGLLEPQGIARAFGGNLLVMDLLAAEAVFTQPGFINRVDVVLEPNARVEAARDAIARALPSGFVVDTPDQRQADLNRIMGSLQAMLQAVGLVGLLTAFLIAFSRLATLFERRAWQIGVLRAIGARVHDLWIELLKQGALVGTMGVAAGLPLGIVVARALLPIVATTSALNYRLVAPEPELVLNSISILLAALLGIGTALLAAVLPAWRAAHVVITQTLRNRGSELESADTRAAWSARALTVGGATLAILLQALLRSAAWGLVATALIAASTAMAARPLLRLARAIVLPRLGTIVGPAERFAAAIAVHNLRRTSLTVAMLAVGLGSIFWLRTVALSFENTLNNGLAHALQGDLIVTSSHIAFGYQEAPLASDLGRALDGVPGVEAVVGEAMVTWSYAGGPITLDAFDAQFFTDSRFGQFPLVGWYAADAWAAVASGRAVVVSTNFSHNLDVAAGDQITLDTPTGPIALAVAGVATNFSSPRGTVMLARELYRQAWEDDQVTRFFLQTAPGAVDMARATIARDLGRAFSLRMLSSRELVAYFAAQVRRAFAPTDVLTALVLGVTLVGVGDTLAAGVAERTRDIGTIRALGIKRRTVGRIIVSEAVLLGAFGLGLAFVAGFVLGAVWVKGTFPYLLGWVLEVSVPYRSLILIALGAIAVCLIAALLPARHAARLEPGIALRYE